MATSKQADAGFTPKRQRSQYTCMATSLSMALESCGIEADEDTVNKVMGAAPMQGASWEQAFAASQHFGARVTFICPATLAQVKAYTDKGVAVMIAWNPEGRPWSHASVIKDVDDEGNVTVADPNIPDPDVLTRTLPKAEFYGKWYEKWESYLVRRPAMAVEREVSPEGRQMAASAAQKVNNMNPIVARVAARHIEAFQFALAQAFADQVGMPDRMNLTQMTKLLGQAFLDLISELDWESNKDLDVTGTGFIEGEYGPAHDYGWENGPPERAEMSIDDVPEEVSGTYTAQATIGQLATSMMGLATSTQFFKQPGRGRKIDAFFAAPKNRTMLERFLNGLSTKEVLANAQFDEISWNDLQKLFNDTKPSGVIGDPGISYSVGGFHWKFEGNRLQFGAKVVFTYDTSDLGVEPPGPDW